MIILKDGAPFEGDDNLDAAKVTQLYNDGIWTDEDLDKHGLDAAEPFVVPDDKVTVGEPSYVEEGGKWIEVYEVDDKPPPPPPPTDEEKLEGSTGLTVFEMQVLLGIPAIGAPTK